MRPLPHSLYVANRVWRTVEPWVIVFVIVLLLSQCTDGGFQPAFISTH